MSSLINRSAILALSRVSNYAVILLSPVLLVRVLDVTQFGQYREFVLYASMLASVLSFAVNRSLMYFLPKHPENEKAYLTQSIIATLAISIAGLSLVWLSKALVLKLVSYDFVGALVLYAFLFINLNFLEYYWLAKRRTDYVLYYTGARLVVRIVTVVTVAYLTRSIDAIILSLVALEALKACFVLGFLVWNRLLTFSLEKRRFVEQIEFFMPLGVAALIGQHINKHLTKVVVAATLGPAALALYAIGAYMHPIIGVGRDSISDVIFPEMARKRSKDPNVLLGLWRRSTVLYCAILLPAAICLFFVSRTLVLMLFTDSYAAAVPIFQIYILYIVTSCFDMGLPLRALNRTRPFVVGNAIALVVNVILMIILTRLLGFEGPAIAYIASTVAGMTYLGWRLLITTGWRFGEMLPWRDISKIVMACLIAVPIFVLGLLLPASDAIRAFVLPAVFLLGYILLIRRMRLADIELLIERLRLRWNVSRRPARSPRSDDA